MGKYERRRKKKFSPWRILLTLVLSIPAMVLTVKILSWGMVNLGVPGNSNAVGAAEMAVMDRFDMKMTNAISSALEGVLSIEKVYWLNDDDQIAPEPNQDNYMVLPLSVWTQRRESFVFFFCQNHITE